MDAQSLKFHICLTHINKGQEQPPDTPARLHLIHGIAKKKTLAGPGLGNTTGVDCHWRIDQFVPKMTGLNENTFSEAGSTVISTQFLSALPDTSTRVKCGVMRPSSSTMALSILK